MGKYNKHRSIFTTRLDEHAFWIVGKYNVSRFRNLTHNDEHAFWIVGKYNRDPIDVDRIKMNMHSE